MTVDISKVSIKVVITGKIRTWLDFLPLFTFGTIFPLNHLMIIGSIKCGVGGGGQSALLST